TKDIPRGGGRVWPAGTPVHRVFRQDLLDGLIADDRYDVIAGDDPRPVVPPLKEGQTYEITADGNGRTESVRAVDIARSVVGSLDAAVLTQPSPPADLALDRSTGDPDPETGDVPEPGD
ncbi:MAG: hypothetical protein AAFY08_16325, partial [Planctomycetota bacterium]